LTVPDVLGVQRLHEEEFVGSIDAPFVGFGDDVIQFTPDLEGAQVLRIQGGSADANFMVWTLAPDLSQLELVVNTIGLYTGTCVAGLEGPVGAIQVQTEGHWSLSFLGPDDLSVLGDQERGFGDSVRFMSADLQPTTTARIVRIEASGSDNLTVWAYGGPPDLLVNVIGAYSGTVVVPRDTQFLAITCDGSWSVTSRG